MRIPLALAVLSLLVAGCANPPAASHPSGLRSSSNQPGINPPGTDIGTSFPGINQPTTTTTADLSNGR